MKQYKKYVLGGVLAGIMVVALTVPTGNVEAFWLFGKVKKENNVNYIGAVVNAKKAGVLSVSADQSSPSYHIVAAGTSNTTLGVLKISATGESIDLNRIEFKMSDKKKSGADLSQTSNIYKLTLWDDQNQVGEAVFVGMNKNTTMVVNSLVVIPKDGYKILVIKADLAEIGQTFIGQQGSLIAVDYVGAEGVGKQSGLTIKSKSRATSFDGVRMFKSFPIVSKVLVPTNTLSNGHMSIYRFKVSSNSVGNVGLYKFTLQVATSATTITSLNVNAYLDSDFLVSVSGVNAGGKLMDKDISGFSNKSDINILIDRNGLPVSLQVPAGETRYFDVTATISGVAVGSSISTQLQGDSAYPKLTTLMGTYLGIEKEAGKNNDFVWSPNATTSSTITHRDWTNGYGVSGLPSANLTAEVISR